MSSQKYSETVIETAGAFGVSASSVSRHIVDITAKKLKEFKERDLSDFRPFAIFIDTIHRGGEAFMVSSGIDAEGYKKDRNIQKHLAKRYRKEAHRRFRVALEQTRYEDARQMLMDFERWLRGINESAADSLLEAIEEILTLHRLKVPAILRQTLSRACFLR